MIDFCKIVFQFLIINGSRESIYKIKNQITIMSLDFLDEAFEFLQKRNVKFRQKGSFFLIK